MDEKQRELVNYFIDHSNDRFKQLEQKVDQLLEHKHKTEGKAAGMSAIISAAMTVAINAIALALK
jgi:Skp family chaperone for outer membrane proteins